MEGGAVSPHPDNYAPNPDDPPLPGREVAAHVAVMLILVGVWHENLHVLANDLFSLVPEQANRGSAEGVNDGCFVYYDHCIRHRFQDRLEVRLTCFEGPLGTHPFSYVADDQRKSRITFQRRQGDVSDERGAVLANSSTLILETAVLADSLKVVICSDGRVFRRRVKN